MTTIKQYKNQINKAMMRERFAYVFGDYKIVRSKNYITVLRNVHRWFFDGRLILHYNTHTHAFGLYEPIEYEILKAFCSYFHINIPYHGHENGLVGYLLTQDIVKFGRENDDHIYFRRPVKQRHNHWYGGYTTVERWETPAGFQEKIIGYAWNWGYRSYGGYSKTEYIWIIIKNKELLKFEPKTGYRPSVVPKEVTHKGENLLIEHGYATRSVVLAQQHTFQNEKINVPVRLDLTPIRYCEDYWGNLDYIDNYNKLRMLISQELMELPVWFEWKKAHFHFYAVPLNADILLKYLEGGCTCKRCRGWEIYVNKFSKAPKIDYYGGLDMLGTQLIWAGKHGFFPDTDQLAYKCKCGWCNRLRKTGRYATYLKKFKLQKLGIVFEKNRRAYEYITLNKQATILYDYNKIPEHAEDLDLKYFRAPKDLINNLNVFNRQRPADNLSLLHSWFCGLSYKEAIRALPIWKDQVFKTQLEPDCNCTICSHIKDAEKLDIRTFYELLIEPIDVRQYPTMLFMKHFSNNSNYYTYKHNKEEMMDYFEKYILKGAYCECEICQGWLNQAKNEKYLPPNELITPLCPRCRRPIHNKRSILEMGEIAKRIIEQGIDTNIGVKSALCCGCHSIESKVRMKLKMLEKAPLGTIVIYKNKEDLTEEGIVKKVYGNKVINDIPLSEFLVEYNGNFKFKDIEKLKDSLFAKATWA